MPQISVPGSGHIGPATIAGWQWQPFADPVLLAYVQRALRIVTGKIDGNVDCDAAFRALPGRRSFGQVWHDPTVWISFDPRAVDGRYGATLGREITLSAYCCRMGVWTIVATLIHELAHVNGADNVSHDAEGTLNHCLMREHHNSAILGRVLRAPRDRIIASVNRTRAVGA